MSSRDYNTGGNLHEIVGNGCDEKFYNFAGGAMVAADLVDGAAADDGDGARLAPTLDGQTGIDASIAFDWTNDSGIPVGSTINNVKITTRIKQDSGVALSFKLSHYERYGGFIARSSDENVIIQPGAAYVNHVGTFSTDPNNNAWTVDNVFTAWFGVTTDLQWTYDTDITAVMKWSWCYITVNFSVPPPIVTTGEATGLLDTQATLNGTLNPDGATATYPCAYYFEYGLDTSYGSVTATVNNQTGSADIAATGTATGLVPGTTYHFRLVSTNADNTIYGDDATFITADVNRFWLDEFHPTDGTLNARALVRWDSVGFNIASALLDCPDLDREDLE